jgi:hypothetical protein
VCKFSQEHARRIIPNLLPQTFGFCLNWLHPSRNHQPGYTLLLSLIPTCQHGFLLWLTGGFAHYSGSLYVAHGVLAEHYIEVAGTVTEETPQQSFIGQLHPGTVGLF